MLVTQDALNPAVLFKTLWVETLFTKYKIKLSPPPSDNQSAKMLVLVDPDRRKVSLLARTCYYDIGFIQEPDHRGGGDVQQVRFNYPAIETCMTINVTTDLATCLQNAYYRITSEAKKEFMKRGKENVLAESINDLCESMSRNVARYRIKEEEGVFQFA